MSCRRKIALLSSTTIKAIRTQDQDRKGLSKILGLPPALCGCERSGSARHSTSVLKTAWNCKREIHCDKFRILSVLFDC
jgi:hypothetical protein